MLRRRHLVDNRKLFEFLREAGDVDVWLKDRAAIAGSDDYGTDLEHVEVRKVDSDSENIYLAFVQ